MRHIVSVCHCHWREISAQTHTHNHFPRCWMNFPVRRVHILRNFADTAVVQCRHHTQHYSCRARIVYSLVVVLESIKFVSKLIFNFNFVKTNPSFCAAKFPNFLFVSFALVAKTNINFDWVVCRIETSNNKREFDEDIFNFHFIDLLISHKSLRAAVECIRILRKQWRTPLVAFEIEQITIELMH